GIQGCYRATAVLENGLGRYQDAFDAAQQACAELPGLYVATWTLPELIEAAARTGNAMAATDAADRLERAAGAADTDWALGVSARWRALVSEGDTAEQLYATALERLGRTRMRTEVARTHLLYGEWLRSEQRNLDARAELRTAYTQFSTMGIHAFAERARG